MTLVIHEHDGKEFMIVPQAVLQQAYNNFCRAKGMYRSVGDSYALFKEFCHITEVVTTDTAGMIEVEAAKRVITLATTHGYALLKAQDARDVTEEG